tara:strand:- start:351 stop:707 length:357 start_codon:yes stop_codon:yes gene_type:complete
MPTVNRSGAGGAAAPLISVGLGRDQSAPDSFGVFEAFVRRRRGTPGATASPKTPSATPARADLAAHVKELVDAHGLEAVAASLIAACPHSQLMQLAQLLCEREECGVEPDCQDGPPEV